MSSKQTEMLSLYDYLGRAAGAKLGKQVAAYAKVRKAKYGTKEVNHHGYQGLIQTYTREFLDEYFKVEKIFTSKQEDLVEINSLLLQDANLIPII